ncbi:hypothetical protein BJX61DRAFT_56567 [Aspergillus egyptiacus]|nr:hypothetical protein BJX61DRAFT_56567 [Aspergillus egyptiacus]
MSLPDIISSRLRTFPPEPIVVSSHSPKKQYDGLPGKQQALPTEAAPSKSGNDIFTIGHSGSTHIQTRDIIEYLHLASAQGESDLRKQEDISAHSSLKKPPTNQERGAKRFTPQLMETGKLSYRPSFYRLADPQARSSSDADRGDDQTPPVNPPVHESRFSYNSLLRCQEARRHSFCLPNLPAIPSSFSEEPGGSDSMLLPDPSVVACRRRGIRLDARIQSGVVRESNFPTTEYMLAFPPHPSEALLKEQALAAFPNEQVYQPVDHFAIDREEDESPWQEGLSFRKRLLKFTPIRRASSADLPFELDYLRRHKEEAGMNRRQYPNAWRARYSHVRQTNEILEKTVRPGDGALAHPRQATSPPMLGDDLIFPQSQTPETTICEGTHTNDLNDRRELCPAIHGLWGASHPSVHRESGGLWNGTCKMDRHNTRDCEPFLPGLISPRHRVEAPAYKFSVESSKLGPQNQQKPRFASHSLEDKFCHSEFTDQEFNDGFVTQIYNYLSLGYPSVARYYDDELSRVSGLSVAALRADDLNTDAQGYVCAHDVTGDGPVEGVCMRWKALRLYIQEWARQEPRTLETGLYHDTWGVRGRKGSWAI